MGKYFYIYAIALVSAIFAGQSSFNFIFVELSGKLPLLLAVLLAAVFVRLARGMPAIPHDKIPAAKALVATKAFRHLISAYVQTFAIFLISIILNLSASSVDSSILYDVSFSIPMTILSIADFLSLASLFYMVSADVKLAKVQADLIEEVVSQAGKRSAMEAVENVGKAFEKSRDVPSISRPADDR